MNDPDPGVTDPNHVYRSDSAVGPSIQQVTGPIDKLSPEAQDAVLRAERTKTMVGLGVGLIVILAGVALLVLGITGQVDIELVQGEVEAKLSTAAVGVVISLIGMGIIWITRLKIVITSE